MAVNIQIPGGQELIQILYDVVRMDHFPEWMTGISTLLLFVSTVLLVVVTYLLARVTRDDSVHRRREATTSAWMKIRADIDMPDVRGLDRDKIIDAGVKIRPLLRQLEAFATCVNLKVYDLETFNRISGGWFVRNFEKINPYITARHLELSHRPYNEMITLNRNLLKLRAKRNWYQIISLSKSK